MQGDLGKGLGHPQSRWGKQDQGQLLPTTLPCKHLEALPENELLSQIKQCTVQLGLSGMSAAILNSL